MFLFNKKKLGEEMYVLIYHQFIMYQIMITKKKERYLLNIHKIDPSQTINCLVTAQYYDRS